jgi:PAS domain S-box-containing protein
MIPPVDKNQKSEGSERRRPHTKENGITLQSGILDQLHDAVITTDLQGNITACNKGVRLYGYSPEDLAGKNISGLYRPEEQAFLARQVIPTVLEKGRFEGELRSRAKSGEDVYVHLSMTLLRDTDSVPAGMVALAIDITDKKLLECALREDASRSADGFGATTVSRREIGGTSSLWRVR